MTAAPEPAEEDGNLKPALRDLHDAIGGLIDPRPEMVEGKLLWTDSLYTQLVEALPGAQGEGHGVPRSLPPLWIDACELLTEIDTAVTIWQKDPGGYDGDLTTQHPPTPETIRRLKLIEKRGWRPQDTKRVEQLTGILQQWVESIANLLTPLPKLELTAPCPACGTRFVYRNDNGDRVRQAALQIGKHGCQCQACHYIWEPYRYRILAAALGCQLPAGVLE
jgi:hypothetical protein